MTRRPGCSRPSTRSRTSSRSGECQPQSHASPGDGEDQHGRNFIIWHTAARLLRPPCKLIGAEDKLLAPALRLTLNTDSV
jgi:hypothetical protein